VVVGVAGASRREPGAAIGVAVLAALASIAALWAAGAEAVFGPGTVIADAALELLVALDSRQ
jgi:methylmalonyl-CoA mutase cobalamin-binding subunit